MTHVRFAAMTIAGVWIFGAAALAKDVWKTVTLRGEPGLTISIPAVADNTVDAKDPNDLMFVALTTPLHGDLVCIAHRAAYEAGATQAVIAAALATGRREVFCSQDGATISGLDIGGSKSFDHNGSQAAVCTSSYTDSAQKLPGIVMSQMVIAAPSKLYYLTCTVEDEDQETAEFEWAMRWEKNVRRIQDSFHVPK